jgi:hypothetical protein
MEAAAGLVDGLLAGTGPVLATGGCCCCRCPKSLLLVALLACASLLADDTGKLALLPACASLTTTTSPALVSLLLLLMLLLLLLMLLLLVSATLPPTPRSLLLLLLLPSLLLLPRTACEPSAPLLGCKYVLLLLSTACKFPCDPLLLLLPFAPTAAWSKLMLEDPAGLLLLLPSLGLTPAAVTPVLFCVKPEGLLLASRAAVPPAAGALLFPSGPAAAPMGCAKLHVIFTCITRHQFYSAHRCVHGMLK